MKRSLFLFFFSFIFLIIGNTQTFVSPNNTVPDRSCNCFTIVDDCSGQQLFLEGFVVQSCKFDDEKYYHHQDIPINSDGTVCMDFDDNCVNDYLCMDAGNWEVCDIEACTIRVFQTVPIDPMINGQILGYGNGYPGWSSGSGRCYRIHHGELNSIYSPSTFQLCSGEEAILTLPGMSIPAGSGLCLTVSVKDLNGNLIASESYDSGMTNGEDVDITSLLVNVGSDIYKLEMRMGCCDASATCTPNTYKFAYFKLRKGFSYQPGLVRYPLNGGGGSFYTPSLVPTGPYVGSAPSFISFFGYNIQASAPTTINYIFSKKECGSEAEYTYVGGGSQTVNPGAPFFGGGIIETDNNRCWCYKVEVSYSDGCSLGGTGITTDTYYFRVGSTRCVEKQEDLDKELGLRDDSDFGISVTENPVNNELKLQWFGKNNDSSFNLEIFDTSGRSIITRKIANVGNETKMHLDVEPGIYFYRIDTNGKTFSGKIIKL